MCISWGDCWNFLRLTFRMYKIWDQIVTYFVYEIFGVWLGFCNRVHDMYVIHVTAIACVKCTQ